jgi:hypothetical protein
VCTGVAGRLCGEARKRCGRTVALLPWWCRMRWRRESGSTGAGPCPMEQDTQPHQGDQPQLVEKEIGDHGKPLSYRW